MSKSYIKDASKHRPLTRAPDKELSEKRNEQNNLRQYEIIIDKIYLHMK